MSTPTTDDFTTMLTAGLVAPDTNVLPTRSSYRWSMR
jgi:hypothetical protein